MKKVVVRARKQVKRIRTRGGYSVVFALLFSIIGIAALLSGGAATTSLSIEPLGTQAQNGATEVSDATASGGKLIQFGGGQSLGEFDIPDRSSTYPVPTDALYVDNTASNKSDASCVAPIGTASQPFATIGKAVSCASDGKTIVVAGTRYYESIGTIRKRIILQAAVGKKPWLDGRRTVISGWTADGVAADGTPIWKAAYDRTGVCTDYESCTNRRDFQGLYLYVDGKQVCKAAGSHEGCSSAGQVLNSDTYDPTPSLYDMVFVNGIASEQVAVANDLKNNSFFVIAGATPATSTIRLASATNPNNHEVRASTLQNAITLEIPRTSGKWNKASGNGAKDSVIRGIGFVGYGSNGQHTTGAVIINAPGVTMQDSSVAWSAGNGLTLGEDGLEGDMNILVNNVRIGYSGHVGGRVIDSHGSTIQNSKIAYSNWEDFTRDGGNVTAAGMKAGSVKNLTVKNSVVEKNKANGIWCDVRCENMHVYGNTVRDNLGSGIFYEISLGGIFANNFMERNVDPDKLSVTANLRLATVRDIKVYNNESRGGTSDGGYQKSALAFLLFFDGRYYYDCDIKNWTPTGCDVIRTNSKTPMENIVVRNNIFADTDDTGTKNPKTLALLLANCKKYTGSEITAQEFGVSLDHNAYYRSTSAPASVFKFANNSLCHSDPDVGYSTLTALQNATVHEDSGVTTNGAAVGTGEPVTDSTLANILGVGVGQPLPIGKIR